MRYSYTIYLITWIAKMYISTGDDRASHKNLTIRLLKLTLHLHSIYYLIELTFSKHNRQTQ